jgi:Sulfotransferase family
MVLGCVLIMTSNNCPDLTRRRMSRFSSDSEITHKLQHGTIQSLKLEETRTDDHFEPQLRPRPSVLVVGGSDGSGTRAVVELLGRLGVPILVDDTGTYDVDALLIAGNKEEKGWPPLVQSVLELTRSANYELDDLPPDALRAFRDQLTTLRTSYQARADELLQRIDARSRTRPTSTPYGFKAPVTMLLLPLLLDAFGSIKFLHVVRDGRDVVISENQSPVQKFYDSYYLHGQRETNDGAYIGDQPGLEYTEMHVRAMRLWNDWNMQAWAWSQSHVDNDAFDYHVVRSEDLISDPQLRLETIQRLAAFVGSPRSSASELCCLLYRMDFDLGPSTPSFPNASSHGQQRTPPWKRRAMMPFADLETMKDRGAGFGTEFLASNLE